MTELQNLLNLLKITLINQMDNTRNSIRNNIIQASNKIKQFNQNTNVDNNILKEGIKDVKHFIIEYFDILDSCR